MFDFSAYLAPIAVLATMLVALVGFGVWGSRAIRESAEEALAELGVKKAEEKTLAPVVEEAQEKPEAELDLLTEMPMADLEHTAEFAQPEFAETHQPEDKPEVDFDAAIERIVADLAAQEQLDNEPKPAVDEDIEATQVIKPEEREAIMREVEAEPELDSEPEIEAKIEAGAEVEVEVEETEADEEAAVGVSEAVDEVTIEAGSEILDKINLEETRVMEQQPDEPEQEAEPEVHPFGEGGEQEEHKDSLFPESPVPFGPKMAWLAIPGYKPSEVISALRLGEVAPANWTKGLSEAYADNKQVFVTPALSGWVLVIGKTLWQKADMNRSAENITWLKDVGRLFGNACFFSTMRGLGNHGWVGIRGGSIVRAYGYSGELQEMIWLYGDPTEEEIGVNPGFATEAEERRQPDFRPVIPDEKMVLAMAAAWSIDVSFSSHKYLPDYGFIGTLE